MQGTCGAVILLAQGYAVAFFNRQFFRDSHFAAIILRGIAKFFLTVTGGERG